MVGEDVAASNQVTLIAVGDNIMHAGICAAAFDAQTDTFDFSPLYAHVAERIGSYDLAAVCQETILVQERSAIGDFPDFGTPVEVADALASAGFDIVEAATNHAFDRGIGGLDDTTSYWAAHHPSVTLLGIHATPEDALRLKVVNVRGMRLALFNATYGLNGHELPEGQEWRIDTLADVLNSTPTNAPADAPANAPVSTPINTSALRAQLQQAERAADASICFLHIGEEYENEPSQEQRLVVGDLVDAGADLVICSHAHVVGPCERVTTAAGNSAVVCWGLGNFASRQTEPRTVLGAAASVQLARNANGAVEVASCDLLPLVCHYAQAETAVYFLDDYTDELARNHALSTTEAPLSVERFREMWADFTRS